MASQEPANQSNATSSTDQQQQPAATSANQERPQPVPAPQAQQPPEAKPQDKSAHGNHNCCQHQSTLQTANTVAPHGHQQGPANHAASIVKKMRSLAGPASKTIVSFKKLAELYEKSKNLLVIGVFKNQDDSLYKQFIETANSHRDLASYVHIFEDKATDKLEKLKPFNADKEFKLPSIVLARPVIYRSKFEPDYLIYDSSDELRDWIVENSDGLVIARGPNNRDIPKPHVIVYYNVDYEKDPKGTNYWRNRVLKVATAYKDQGVTFAISNIGSFHADLSEYGVDMAKVAKDAVPAVVAKDSDGKKYSLQKKMSVDTLSTFVKDLLDGKLEPFLKSEDEPDNEGASVKIAVGKNFDQLVTKSKKDILIEFYAPWCGHCKALSPQWDELGLKLKDEPNVDIVKIDATANNFPDTFTVHGFPTIYWYPADTKTPVKYEGGRDSSDFLAYIAKQATEELVGYDRDGNEKKRDEL